MSAISTLLGAPRFIGRTYIDGLGTANATDSDHDISIAVGECRDSTNQFHMILGSPLVKQIDASFSAGTNAGGMFTGAVGNATWYHLFLIRSSAGVIDAGWDTSVTCANRPAGYVAHRRIASMLTNGSANIVAYRQNLSRFEWAAPVEDLVNVSTGTARTLKTMTVPLGISVEALIDLYAYNASGTYVYAWDPNNADASPTIGSVHGSAGYYLGMGIRSIPTNTSSQIAIKCGAASTGVWCSTIGWVDARGSEQSITTGTGGQLAMPRGYIDGLTLTNNVSDANNDIDFGAGVARDSANTGNLVLTATLTKQLDAAWVAGAGGGIDTGSKAVSTWYHCYVISNGATTDALFSTSATAPTMPAGYTMKRRVGVVRTNSSGNIIAFWQKKDEFWWTSPLVNTVDATTTTLSSSSVTYTMGFCPPNVCGIFDVWGFNSGASLLIYLRSLNSADEAVDGNGTNALISGGSGHMQSDEIHLWTDASSQVAARAYAASTNMSIKTLGWVDPRGKDA